MTVLAFVIGIVIMAVGLAVSIALHELGHLWPAKKFGVRVDQYMIGFGPTLWSRRRGETEYGFKAIPLGGYISMAGMYPPTPPAATARARAAGGFFATMVQDARAANVETLAGADNRVFYRLPVYQRIIVMLGGPIMNFLFAIVLFAILFSGIGVQTATSTVSELSECVPASASAECTPADPTAPAVAAGLQPGDRIVAIDGQPVDTFDEVAAMVRQAPGRALTMLIDRDGAPQTITVTPAVMAGQDAEGTAVDIGFLGVRPTLDYVREPIWAGPAAALENTVAVANIIWQLPVLVWDTAVTLVTGQERDPDGPLSIVGAGVIAGEVAAAEAPLLNRIGALVGLLASINIALFVFNLIPLLPLDGGHVVVALWDGAKRTGAKLLGRPPPKPVDASKLVPLTFVVFIALLVMGAVLILADLFNPVDLF